MMNVLKELTIDEIEVSANALIGRFGKDAAKVRDEAVAAADAAIKEADRLEALSQVPSFKSSETEFGKTAAVLRSTEVAVRALVSGFDVQADPPNAAAEYAHRALDLQVAKSGGLLAYNALGFTVATLLWATHARWEGLDALRYAVVLLLFLSSFFCLTSILVRWPNDTTIASATLDLKSTIRLAHDRARAINAATVLAIGATFILVLWMALPERAQQRDVAVKADGAAVPTSLADTLHLRCTWSTEGSSRLRDWACSVAPQSPRIRPDEK